MWTFPPCSGKRRAWTPSSRPPAGAIGVGRKVLEQYDDIASQEAIQAYFHMFLELNGAKAQDKYGILSKFTRIRSPSSPWRSAST